MAITVKHTKVSTVPDGDDTSVVRPSDWNDDHALTGLGTMAEQNANAVAITGGTISGVTLPASNITGTLDVGHGGTGATTLTGYVKGTGTAALTASSTIPNTDITGLGTASTKDAGAALGVATLDASGKVPISELPAAVLGALSYQGTWDASTNTPTLTSSVGTKGYYYVVSVAGNTNLNGITDWLVGDWAVFNGSVWQKVDNTDAVTSVNGLTGAVVLTTTNIAEGTNEYFTTAKARASVSAGTGISYDSGTGVITNSSPSLGGDVVGPSSATDNAIARFDSTTGKLLQNSVVTVGDTGAVTGVTTASASTSVTTPIVQASNSGGLALKNSGGTTQMSVGAGGGDNMSINVSTNINGTNAQIDISPTGTGHVHMKPTGTGSIEMNPTSVGTIDNMTIGATTPKAITGTTVTATSFVGSGASLTNVVNSAAAGTGISVSGSTGAVTVTNTAPDQTVAIASGTGISVSGTYPNFTVTNTAPSSGGTVTSVTGTAPVVSSGGNTPAISMAAANTTTDGYLTSTDWNTFNGKSNTNGTVTSVAALTLGTTGTDLSSTVANGTTTPVITLQVPTASATNRGALSAADWTTFNNKGSGSVTSVAATVPSFLSVSGSPITTSGTLALTYSGTALPVANGGTGTATAFTAGSVVFAGASGVYTQDNANFFWDATNHKLGIGTASPNGKLDVAYTSTAPSLSSYAGSAFTLTASSTAVLQFGSYSSGSYGNWVQSNNLSNAVQSLSLNPLGGNVGIGQSSPSYLLDVNGTAHINGVLTLESNLVLPSGTTIYNTSGDIYLRAGTSGNVYVGAGNANSLLNLFASGGVSIGNTTDAGAGNLSVTGKATVQGLTVGLGGGNISSNTAIGVSALSANSTGYNNTALGVNAGQTNSTGVQNTSIGQGALYANTTNNNTAVGAQSAINNIGGTVDAFGFSALYNNTSGNSNSSFGNSSLFTNITNSNCAAFGYSALYYSKADGNSAFGTLAGYKTTSGNANVYLGYKAGYDNTTSANNVFIGYLSGQVQATGFQNIYIGYNTTSSAAGASNEIVIGQGSTGKGSNTGFFNPNGGGVYQGNNSVSWSITSDARIKENVITLENALDIILALRPVKFNYIETKKHDISFIAQEYQKVLPEQIIKHAPNKIEKDLIGNDNEVLGIQQNLVPYLVKALQELNNKFDAYAASHP